MTALISANGLSLRYFPFFFIFGKLPGFLQGKILPFP